MAPEGAPLEATTAAAALWRGVKRIAANDVVLVSFVLGALIVFFFYDIVFLGRTLTTSLTQPGVLGFAPPFGYPDGHPDHNPYLVDPLASAAGAEPIVERMGRLIWDLQVSLWNPNIALGRPFLAEASNANFSVIRLPLMLWSTPEMWDAFLLARFFVTGLFTYLLAKRLGLAKSAALGTAVAFTFSGFFMLKVNMEHVEFAMMIPVLLYAFELLLERPGPARTAFAVAAVAVGVLATNTQPAVVLLLYGSAYYLARTLALRSSEGASQLWPRVLPLGVVLGLGVGLTAFVLLPLVELSGALGSSDLGVHRHAGRGLRFDSLPALISVFVPYFKGPPMDSFHGPGWTGIRNYVGVVTPILAFIGLGNRPAMKKAGWFFLGATVILLAKTYGIPGVNWIGRLPVLSVVDFPQYLPPAIAFSLAMLAGLGLDRLSREGWRWWYAPLAVVVFASLLGWLVWLNRDILGSIPDTHLLAHLGFAGALILAAAAILFVTQRNIVPSSAAVALLVGLITVELFAFAAPTKGEFTDLAQAVYGPGDVGVVDRPQRYDPFTQPPYIDFIKNDTSKFRVVGLNGILFPNTSEAYNIDDIRGLVGVSVDRYMKYIRNFVDPSSLGHRWDGRRWPPLNKKGGISLLSNNPMLDLLNVKYVITPQSSLLAYDLDLAAQFLPAVPEKDSTIRLDAFTINGEDKAVLFQHPESSLAHTLTPDEESSFLLFRLGLDPEVWQPNRGDGVLFEVTVREDGTEEALFSRWVDPKNNPEDRRWIDGAVDLTPYLGQPVTLVLSTSGGDNPGWDWAGWGDLRLAPSPEMPADQSVSIGFELVYDEEVQVYQRPNAFARAFVVHRAELAEGKDSAVSLMQRPGFDPSTEAVVEASLSDDQLAALAGSPAIDGSSVRISRYDDTRVDLLVRMENPGLLVLSDTYYPGWKATVDGQRVPIYPTDLALRSVFVPAGEHNVEFVFSPGSFKLGLTISAASLAILVAYLAFGPMRNIVRARLGKREGGG